AQVGEALVEVRQLLVGDGGEGADHQAVADPADRVVPAVEAGDQPAGGGDVVGAVGQVDVLGVDVAALGQLVDDEPGPRVPVGPAGLVEEHDGGGDGLAGLLEGEQLQRLVEGAEAAGEGDEAGRLLHQHELAGEEV